MPETTTWVDPDGNVTQLSGQVDTEVLWGVEGRHMPPIDFIEEQVPLQPGTRLRTVKVKPRDVSLPFVFDSATETALRTKIRAITKAMDPQKGVGKLRVVGPDGGTRELNCCYRGGLELTESKESAGANWQMAVILLRAFDPFWYDTSDQEGFYILNADQFGPASTFSRASTAHRQDGSEVASGLARYETGKYGQAIMVEEATTNLLTANQSNIETGTTGWAVGGNCTIARSTLFAWEGAASLELTVTAAGDAEATTPTGVAGLAVLPSTSYTVSGYRRSAVSRTFGVMVREYDSAGTLINTNHAMTASSTTGFTRNTHTFTSQATAAFASVSAYVIGAAAGEKHYIDGIQLEQKAYVRSSWQIGGTPRVAETLTIPSSVLQSSAGTIEGWFYEDASTRLAKLFDTTPTGATRNYIQKTATQYQLALNNAQVDTEPFPAAGWHHIAVVWTSTTWAWYIDGVSKGSGVLGSALSWGTLFLGSDGSGVQQWGLIDDIRISNKARTAAEIAATAASASPAPVDDDTTFKSAVNTDSSNLFFPFFPLDLNNSILSATPTINNTGDVEAWPVWTVTGPGSSILLKNVTTGKEIRLDVTLAAGESITIDTRPGYKTIKRTDGTSLYPLLSIDSGSTLWPLRVGNNSVALTLGDATSASSIQLAYKRRYLGA